VGCKFKETEGFHLSIHTEPTWDYKKCTQLANTDAFGELNFPGSHSKTAKVNLYLKSAILKKY
jgi:hypothetical protein